MKHLYIIGNGFDIHHRMKCGFKDYAKWLELNHPDVYYNVEDKYFAYDKEQWKDFEHLLGELDVRHHTKRITDDRFPSQKKFAESEGKAFEDLKRRYEQSVDEAREEFEELYESIRESFREWVEQLESPNDEYMLPIIRDDGIFITFNYTDTLETLYRIPKEQILYVHGNAKRGDELILGHGLSDEDIRNANAEELPDDVDTPEKIEAFYRSRGDLIQDETFDVMCKQLAAQVKPVGRLMNKVVQFLEHPEDIEKIHVYGFSFSDIDMPYLYRVASMIDLNKVQWKVSYFKPEEHGEFEDKLDEIGVPKDNRELIKLTDLKRYGGCLELFKLKECD